MNKVAYSIYQNNNELSLFEAEKKEQMLHSFWFMEFGKTASEIKNAKGVLLYEATKKFEFWKWKLAYYIKKSDGEKKMRLLAQNSRNTVFKLVYDTEIFEIKIQFQKKKSVYKNGQKIAEIDASFAKSEFMKLVLLEPKELEIVFVLLACLYIGETNANSKSSFKSQKTLEKNDDVWI